MTDTEQLLDVLIWWTRIMDIAHRSKNEELSILFDCLNEKLQDLKTSIDESKGELA